MRGQKLKLNMLSPKSADTARSQTKGGGNQWPGGQWGGGGGLMFEKIIQSEANLVQLFI